MNKLITPRIQLCLIAAFAAAILLANPVPSLAQTPQAKSSPSITVPTPPPVAAGEKNQTIDLRQRMNQGKFKEGRNVVDSGGGVKLIAEVKGGKVARWTATDEKGKRLATQTAQKGVSCFVCVLIPGRDLVCYRIDCKDAPPAPPKKAARLRSSEIGKEFG